MNHWDSMEARLLHNIFLCRRAEGQQGWWGRSWTADPHPLPTPPVYLNVSRIWPLFSFLSHAPSHLPQVAITTFGVVDPPYTVIYDTLQNCQSINVSVFIYNNNELENLWKNGFKTKLWSFFVLPPLTDELLTFT